MDTNIIANNELVFSYEYILSNSKIVGLFIKEIIEERKITKIVVDKFEMFKILEGPFSIFDKLESLYISDETNFTFVIQGDETRCGIVKNLRHHRIYDAQIIPHFLPRVAILVQIRLFYGMHIHGG